LEGAFGIEINQFSKNNIYIVGVKGIFANSFKKKYIPVFNIDYFHKWKQVWWFYHDKGLLPYSKGWYEHNKKTIRIIEMFDNLYAHYLTDKENKATAKLNREIERKNNKK